MRKKRFEPSAKLWRKLALRSLGGKCKECGREEDLFIHHKDGDDSNDDASNLEILCRPCHTEYHVKIRAQNDVSMLTRPLKRGEVEAGAVWIVDYDLPEGWERRRFYRAVHGWLREHVTGETTGWSTQSVVITEDKEFAEFVYEKAIKLGKAHIYRAQKVK